MDKNREDLISVIIPVYRVEEYLRRCVDSVLAQSYSHMEVILVDDGSPDGCPAICDAYGEADSRVKVIHQENAGLSGARNTGIEAAEGSYLAFVDSDDYLAPEFLERLHRACVETDSDLSMCRWEYVKGEAVPERGSGRTETYTGREMLANLYVPDGAYFVVAWNKLYRRELFEKIRYPLGRIHEDEATTYRIFDQVKRAAFVDSSLYGYFVTPVSITRGFNPKRMDWVTSVAERMDFFEKKGYREGGMKKDEGLGTRARASHQRPQEQKAERPGAQPLLHRPERARRPHLLRPSFLRCRVLFRHQEFDKPRVRVPG